MCQFCATLFALTLTFCSVAFLPAGAQVQGGASQAPPAAITGTVLDDQQRPVVGAQVRLSGPVKLEAVTGANGKFAFRGLAPGVFRVQISKAGFTSVTQEGINPVVASPVDLRITLQPASFSSLRTIGVVSVAARGTNSLNTTSAAIADAPGSAFVQQGELAVTRVLNQLPGITLSPTSGFGTNTTFLNNASSPLAIGVPQIRGALPYETASLIDGHPISIGVTGIFSPVFINPYVLQDVEVVKGPGASAPNINYAIGGTVNYRTLEPTRERRESLDAGIDQFGGQTANLRATGSLPGNHWSYAFDYATQGTQGFERGFDPIYGLIFLGPTSINGTPICGNPAVVLCGFTVAPGDPRFLGSTAYGSTFVSCCPHLPMNFNARNELGKIRYAFTPSTSLTFTYLGAQSRGSFVGGELFALSGSTFAPPPGYHGSLAPGAAIPFPTGADVQSLAESNNNLFQTEFRTALGKTVTLLARQYAAGVQSWHGGPGNAGPAAAASFQIPGTLYGGVPLNNDTTPTIFNGTPASLMAPDYYGGQRNRDRLNGYTVYLNKQAGDALVTLSYDWVKTTSFAATESALPFGASVGVPDGTAQTFQTVMLRGQVPLSSHVRATLSNYVIKYTDRYSQDGGKSFVESRHSYDAPRLALTWRPNANFSVRSAAGFSLAPPYANLLANSGAVLPANIFPPTYYTTTANSGDVRPETAFGFDIGFDTRLSSFNVLSLDAYQTTLHDQFLQTTSQQGTYTPPAGSGFPEVPKPLYVTRTQNLGHSRYQGLELSLRRVPPIGAGYTISGSLIRGYPYDLPPGFYDTAAGPNTANLAVIPNINFQSTGLLYNGLSTSRVPYSMGYAEYNYRWRWGGYFLAGLTYYGPNNGFNEPAFGVVNASYSQSLTRRASLQVSVSNLTNAYGNYYYTYPGASVPTPLKNGLLGYAPANVIGPSTIRLILHYEL